MENKKSKVKISGWSKDADNRIKNRKWLRYSGKIALRIMAAMEDRPDMNQAALAKAIGVTPQYVSKLLKGHQNLSLETISKISEALGVELIAFPEFKYSRPIAQMNKDCKVKADQDQQLGLSVDRPEVSGLLSVEGDEVALPLKMSSKKSKAGMHIQVSI